MPCKWLRLPYSIGSKEQIRTATVPVRCKSTPPTPYAVKVFPMLTDVPYALCRATGTTLWSSLRETRCSGPQHPPLWASTNSYARNAIEKLTEIKYGKQITKTCTLPHLLHRRFLSRSVLEEIGSGQFGNVSKGLWMYKNVSMKVAVKSLNKTAGEGERVKFLQEAAIMGQFYHPNIVRLHGVVTVGDPVRLVY